MKSIATQAAIGAFVGLAAAMQQRGIPRYRYAIDACVSGIAIGALAAINENFALIILGAAAHAVLRVAVSPDGMTAKNIVIGAIYGGAFNAYCVFYT
jgi:type IV secretory pathway VirB3-like protein